MRESVAGRWLGWLVCGARNVKVNAHHGLKGFTLSTPSVAVNACIKVRLATSTGGCEKNGARTGSKHGALGVLIHPGKQRCEQRFVATCNPHGGGFPTREHQRIEGFVDVVGPAAFHNLHLNTQLLSSAAKRFSMLVTGSLEHGQTHTQHGLRSMHFPISPTHQEPNKRGLSSMHFKDRRGVR